MSEQDQTVTGMVARRVEPRVWESIRDIPQSCICRSWHWVDHRWELLSIEAGCPWHDQSEIRLQSFHDAAMEEDRHGD